MKPWEAVKVMFDFAVYSQTYQTSLLGCQINIIAAREMAETCLEQ